MILSLTDRELTILKTLRSGPLYIGALELIVLGSNGLGTLRTELKRLAGAELIRLAEEIGPSTYEITDTGREALDQ